MVNIKLLKDTNMKLKNILLISTLFIPLLANVTEVKTLPSSTLESMDIPSLIEEAKIASLEDRTKIENLIRKKIAKAHRES